MGYHIKKIKKGQIGESSKIKEEVEELIDSENQSCKIMALVELSDIYGAIELYLQKHYPSLSMADLKKMSDITQRAFRDGSRK
jgi:hypothetical protein